MIGPGCLDLHLKCSTENAYQAIHNVSVFLLVFLGGTLVTEQSLALCDTTDP